MSQTETYRPRVVILGNHDDHVASALDTLRPSIQSQADIVLEDLGNQQDLSRIQADLAIVLGGDGAILRSAKQMGTRQMPVLGVNLGRLGFLADLAIDELADVFASVCAGQYQVIEHLMFNCEITRGGRLVDKVLGLNEVAIVGGPPYRIVDIELYVDGEMVTTYSCDGLILSTPVGSTAHNLSAGGPILRKSLQAFVISAISPHTLTVRPVVDSADRTYEVAVLRTGEATAVVVDGQIIRNITVDDRVCVRRAPQTFRTIEVAGHSYYRTLREKLGWGGRLRPPTKSAP
jgi:NAD+ kinase